MNDSIIAGTGIAPSRLKSPPAYRRQILAIEMEASAQLSACHFDKLKQFIEFCSLDFKLRDELVKHLTKSRQNVIARFEAFLRCLNLPEGVAPTYQELNEEFLPLLRKERLETVIMLLAELRLEAESAHDRTMRRKIDSGLVVLGTKHV
jgi:hypothetical protein